MAIRSPNEAWWAAHNATHSLCTTHSKECREKLLEAAIIIAATISEILL